MVVEETVAFKHGPEARVVPFFSMDLSQDLGRIEPHKGRFPCAFEEALFFLLLAPWEGWSTMPEVDWAGFCVPWVYTVDSDIFVRPGSPPSPDTLSWEDRIYDDGYGRTYEEEQPVELRLDDNAATELTVWDQSRWVIVEQAKQSVLFETPVAHFLIRAFLAEGVDEFSPTSQRSRRRWGCAPTNRRVSVLRLIAIRECARRTGCEGVSPACSVTVAMLTNMSSSST
ncbi:hypothetical protein [Paracoccus tibetensis]|uniref:Uncharacterized protein n=1 Tax=Paracoccus tibetensis TaxID=336292 RepID=A0A1G5FMC1_9RHOB|nr:hypothetical protein [Paracoccus tibetensis]SCY39980.1 hypothetical protein SAMN05660710_01460 [Paracoccus tibetensis]